MSKNTQLLHSFVTLRANAQRLAESEIQTIAGFLKELEAELTNEIFNNPNIKTYNKAKLQAFIASSQKIIEERYQRIANNHIKFLTNTFLVQQKGTQKVFQDMDISISYSPLKAAQVKSTIKNAFVRGAPVSGWWNKMCRDMKDAFAQQMRIGFASREDVYALVTRLKGRTTGVTQEYLINDHPKHFAQYKGGLIDIYVNRALSLVRTSVLQSADMAEQRILKQNKSLLQAVMWVAVLDDRTTLFCATRNGLLYDLDGNPIGHNTPFEGGPPAHWNCRSVLVPVLKGEDIPQEPTFDEWFSSMTKEEQISYLGKRKYEIRDKLPFQHLTNQSGNPITLQQLAYTYGLSLSSLA